MENGRRVGRKEEQKKSIEGRRERGGSRKEEGERREKRGKKRRREGKKGEERNIIQYPFYPF